MVRFLGETPLRGRTVSAILIRSCNAMETILRSITNLGITASARHRDPHATSVLPAAGEPRTSTRGASRT